MEQIFGSLPGKIGFYSKNYVTGEVISYNENTAVSAASLIKLYIMATAYMKDSENKLSFNKPFILHDQHKLPSCGALNLMHDGLRVTLGDLVALMIALSDNTATNLLIEELSIPCINNVIKLLGCKQTYLRRRLFDREAAAAGVMNTTSAADCATFFERLYKGEFPDKRRSAAMLELLQNQRLNGKIPFFIHRDAEISHKTGEDNGISHDVGIVWAKQPFFVGFCGEGTDVPRFERIMQDVTKELFDRYNK